MIENRYSVSTSVEPHEPAATDPLWEGHGLDPEPATVHGKRILVVDDEESIRACLRMMLELDGHHVTEACNGAEALHLFNLAEFDLVITDYQMPVMEGNKVAVGIKLAAPSLPILMITASARARREVDNPVDALLSKPFTLTDLRCALSKLLTARTEPARRNAVRAEDSSAVTRVPEADLVASLPA